MRTMPIRDLMANFKFFRVFFESEDQSFIGLSGYVRTGYNEDQQDHNIKYYPFLKGNMMSIYETDHFILEAHSRPEIDRLEGGHMKISPKQVFEDRSELTPEQSIELMRLTIVAGLALKHVMREAGVEIGRINYQDNGNWNPTLHIHIYGRAKGAVMQKYGDPITPGHKNEYAPLNAEDRKRIYTEIERLFKEDRFSNKAWKL